MIRLTHVQEDPLRVVWVFVGMKERRNRKTHEHAGCHLHRFDCSASNCETPSDRVDSILALLVVRCSLVIDIVKHQKHQQHETRLTLLWRLRWIWSLYTERSWCVQRCSCCCLMRPEERVGIDGHLSRWTISSVTTLRSRRSWKEHQSRSDQRQREKQHQQPLGTRHSSVSRWDEMRWDERRWCVSDVVVDRLKRLSVGFDEFLKKGHCESRASINCE